MELDQLVYLHAGRVLPAGAGHPRAHSHAMAAWTD
jgi:hypothetical protein